MAVEPSEREGFLAGLLDKSLSEYESKRSDLAQLVRGVESIIDSLATVADACWVADLRRLWGTLEIVYAIMLDEGRSSLSANEQRDVAAAVVGLRALIKR